MIRSAAAGRFTSRRAIDHVTKMRMILMNIAAYMLEMYLEPKIDWNAAST